MNPMPKGLPPRQQSKSQRNVASTSGGWRLVLSLFWVAVKELKLHYHNVDTTSFTMYPYYGNLNSVPQQQPSFSLHRGRGHLPTQAVFTIACLGQLWWACCKSVASFREPNASAIVWGIGHSLGSLYNLGLRH